MNPRSGEVTGHRRARHIFDLIVANARGATAIRHRLHRPHQPRQPDTERWPDRGDQPLRRTAAAPVRVLQPRVAQPRSVRDLEGDKRDSTGRGCRVIPDCVRFLDDVIDLNRYPIEEIDRATKLTRKVGLGLMGWHDALMQLGVPYDSGRLSRWPRRSRASSRRRQTRRHSSWPASGALSRRSPARATTRTARTATRRAQRWRPPARSRSSPTARRASSRCSRSPTHASTTSMQTTPRSLTTLREVNRYFLQAAKDAASTAKI